MRKAGSFLVILVFYIAFLAGCGETNPEDSYWRETERAFTISAFNDYLKQYPNGKYAQTAEANIKALGQALAQGARPLEGNVESINRSEGTIVINTSMGKTETLRHAGDTAISKESNRKTLDDISSGEGVRIDYVNLPNGMLLARKIAIGYSVSHCSCGSSCSCPLSRGCRSIVY